MTCLPLRVLFPGQGGERRQGECSPWAGALRGLRHAVVHSEGVGQTAPEGKLGTLQAAVRQAKRCTV